MTSERPGQRKGVLALRFDVDSIRCIEEGIPRLRRLADDLDVRFTFFVNMGRSFNWWYTVRHVVRRVATKAGRGGRGKDGGGSTAPQGTQPTGPLSLPTTAKLGWWAVIRTMASNPMLGDRYRSTFDELHADGHELGLHGGTDHVIWQRALDELTPEELERLFRPAYEDFTARYGAPSGFASPGFRFNELVMSLLDEVGFVYASDMDGETPFRAGHPEHRLYQHHQVPVNVLGEGNVPMIEQGLARGISEDAIVEGVIERIEARDYALMYGHPYVEGIRADLLRRVLHAVRPRYDIVTVDEYLRSWKADQDHGSGP